MVAYFALLSFVPLVFLALALLGFAHRADASDFLVRELGRAFPGSSIGSILSLVHKVQDNATALGVIGGIGLLWSSLSMFSALESVLNIVYGKPPVVPARQAARRHGDGGVARNAVREPRCRCARR